MAPNAIALVADQQTCPPVPPALSDALVALFEDYSDARTDYGPAPTRADIATPEAAAARAVELVRTYLGLQPALLG